MAGHVPKRHLKLPEVDKLLLDGVILWKWEEGDPTPQKLTFKADKDGFFLSARGEDINKVYDSYVWDLQLVSDVRGGKIPKDARLLDSLLTLTGTETLEGFSLTLVYRRDGIVNLDWINLVCEWPDTAERFKRAVNALTYSMLHAHAAPSVFYRKNYTKILLHADGQGRIPLKYINRMMMTKNTPTSYINQFLAGFNIVVTPEEKGADKYMRAESFTWDVYVRLIDQLLNNRTGDLDLIIPSV
jgi:phosphatidylinositol phospholipase C beta